MPRERLIRLATAEPRPSVVSLVAPPGFGKTVLLADWAAREERPVAWLTLDDDDNVPSVFLTYIAAAIGRIAPLDGRIRSALIAAGPRILATAVPRIASELHRIGRPAILVLDDVHRLVDPTSLDALSTLLDHLPPGFQVVIAARAEPNLPFARLRADRDLLEIRRSELALDPAETEAVAAAAGCPLTADEARLLTERTEGWAAGIYLAALARRNAGGAAATGSISGRDQYIAEYFRSEVGPDFDEDDMTFLTQTSILEVVEPRAAESVMGLPGAAERLRSLAHVNQLIAEVAGSEVTYRYHGLLREYLQGELERREPRALRECHRRASSWYARTGQTDLAIKHAMSSGDIDAAADLVTAAALSTFYGGHADTLERWLRIFDDASLARHAPLAVIAGWIHLLGGRAVAADRMADIADHSTFTGTPGDGSASFESARAMLRAIMARRGPQDVLANAMLAASAEPPGSPWRSNALWLLGAAHRMNGDAAAADAAFADAVDSGASSAATAMVALAHRASLAMARGDWSAAERLAEESEGVLTGVHFGEMVGSLIVCAVAARVAIHRGDHARGRQALVRAQLLRPLASHAVPWFCVQALVEIGRAYLAISDHAGARNAIREADWIARRRPALGVHVAELAEMHRRLQHASHTLGGSSTLTAAELRLLPVLSTHLTFQDIADRLYVSRNTVKSQAMSIYGKLQASSRSEAVARAVEIGLLEPFPGLPSARGESGD